MTGCRRGARRAMQAYGASGHPLPNGGWSLRIGKLLASPNRNPAAHWSSHHRDKKAWEAAIRSALVIAANVRTWDAYRTLVALKAGRQRMRLQVVREVPSARNFIKDRDNLLFSTKRMRDALKGVGLIYDDSMAWLEMPDPIQRVSDDGQAWTVLTIEPLEGAK